MTQARGAASRLIFQKETTFRTKPGSAAAVLLPYTTWDVGRDQQRQTDPSITDDPLPAKSGCGDPIVNGSFGSILDLRSIGNWLTLLLGAPTVNAGIGKQPTNVTGVTIHYADTDAAGTGGGTLSYTSSGKTLSWQEPGGSAAGADTDVSAGGDFTIPGSGAGKGIFVTVDAGALPAADASDTDISVPSTLYAHAFPFNMDDRPSAFAEMGQTDINKYYQVLGLKLNKLSWDVGNIEQNISGDVIAGEEVDPVPTASFDDTPTSYTSLRACGSGGKVTDGGTGLGTITGATIAVNNNMTGYPYVDGKSGYGTIDQGEVNITGTMKAVFDGAGIYALARAATSTRARLMSQASGGDYMFSLAVDLPNIEFTEKAPPRQGKTGLFVELDWNAHRGGTDKPKFILTNDVASY